MTKEIAKIEDQETVIVSLTGYGNAVVKVEQEVPQGIEIADRYKMLMQKAEYSGLDHRKVINLGTKATMEILCNRIKTSDDVSRNLGYPSLGDIAKYDRVKQASNMVYFSVSLFTGIINVTNKLPEVALRFISDDVVSSYPQLCISEIPYILRQGISGRYGEIYNALRVDTVIGWFEQYCNTERSEIYHSQIRRKQEQENRRQVEEFAKAPQLSEADRLKQLDFAKKLTAIALSKQEKPYEGIDKRAANLEHWCELNGQDYQGYLLEISRQVEIDMASGLAPAGMDSKTYASVLEIVKFKEVLDAKPAKS